MKYIILHDSTYHADFDDFEEADNYYWKMVDEDGDWFDITLLSVVERHEAPEREHEPLTNGRHFNLDTAPNLTTESQNDIAKNWKDSMKKIHSAWFDRGKY